LLGCTLTKPSSNDGFRQYAKNILLYFHKYSFASSGLMDHFQ
jgi:hypothetical protein